MRYKLDVDGYVCAIAFGSCMDGCTEYTGNVPKGYYSLDDWATNSNINAYYIEEGNLLLDEEKLLLLKDKIALETIDNTPVLRKDIYGSEEVLNSQYKKEKVTGEIVTLENIPRIPPRVKITGIKPYEYEGLKIFTQGENIMPFGAKNEVISDVTFTVVGNTVNMVGSANADIFYTLSGSDTNTTPLFALKYGTGYGISVPSFASVQFLYNKTIVEEVKGNFQTGNYKITHVVLKIPKGTYIGSYSFTPSLAIETVTNAEYKGKTLDIDFSKYIKHKEIYPNKALYPSKTLYPKELINFKETTIEHILIENGVIYASIDGKARAIGSGNVALFSDYNNIYASEGVDLEVEYCKNIYDVKDMEFLQGTQTQDGRFQILADGSIVAKNGTFEGKVTSSDAQITGGKLEITADYYTEEIINVKTTEQDETYSVGISSEHIDVNGPSAKSSIYGGGIYMQSESDIAPSSYWRTNDCQFPKTKVKGDLEVTGKINGYSIENLVKRIEELEERMN